MPTPSSEAGQPRAVSGFALILAATIVSGIASYVVTWLVPRSIGFADYAAFAVFWASIYLVVGALFGIQQEVTRGTLRLPLGASPEVNRSRNFGLIAGVAVFAVIIGTAPLWVGAVFPDDGWALVLPLAVGAAGFVMVAVLCGSLYGVAEWRALAAMMIGDSVLRLVAVAITLAFSGDVVPLAWAVAVPFPLTLVLLWPVIRSRIVGRTQLDVGYRALTWNVARTVVAAAATGAMVSGLPLLIGLTSSSEPDAAVGLIVLTTTLVRAPLIIVTMSLQSLLIVTFRDRPDRFWRMLLGLQGLILVAGVVLAGIGWWLGPPVFSWLFPGQDVPDGGLIAALIASSALVGCLCVSAPAVLARNQHLVYSIGWAAAAVATVILLLLPLELTARVLAAVLVGPVVGLLVNSVYLGVSRRAEVSSGSATASE